MADVEAPRLNNLGVVIFVDVGAVAKVIEPVPTVVKLSIVSVPTVVSVGVKPVVV